MIKILNIILVFIFIFFLPIFADNDEIKNYSFYLSDGKIFRKTADRSEPVDVEGKVEFLSSRNGTVFYIKSKPENIIDYIVKSSVIFVGFWNFENNLKQEYKLLQNTTPENIKKFFVTGNSSVCVLYQNAATTSDKSLMFVDMNSTTTSTKDNVSDAEVVNGKIAVLEKSGAEFVLNYNGKILSLNFDKNVYFKNILDSRILFISNDSETEVVDIVNMKSIYRYSDKFEYLTPKDFNIAVEIADETEEALNPAVSLYYEIFVDGEEAGRTETGPVGRVLNFKGMLAAEKNHKIKFIRWELKPNNSSYVKVNNIRQPRPFKIYIPSGRVIKVEMKYDGMGYKFNKYEMKK